MVGGQSALPHCVSRAHCGKETFVLLKNGVPFVRLVRAPERACSGRQLAAALTEVALAPAEARTWTRDVKAAKAPSIHA